MRCQTGGYPAIALMMAVESSLFPLPSEIVIRRRALGAHRTNPVEPVGHLLLAGTLGSWFGATLMYWASRLAAGRFVLHFGKILFHFHLQSGGRGTLGGALRLDGHFYFAAGCRSCGNLIGIPAGIVRMDYLKVFPVHAARFGHLVLRAVATLASRPGRTVN